MDNFVETIPVGLFFVHFGYNNQYLNQFKSNHPGAKYYNFLIDDDFPYLRVPDWIQKLFRSNPAQASKSYEQSIITRESARIQLKQLIQQSEKCEVVLIGFFRDEKALGDYRSVISRLINDYNAGLLSL
jgi:hypothetical protein